MRRSRTALTAWPAFADLMTVLAVLGLAIAAGVAGVDAPSDEETELAAARERNADLAARLEEAETLKDELAAAQKRNADLAARLEEAEAQEADLTARLEEAEQREVERRLGSFPCLGTRTGSRTAPVPLLRIVVDSGYRLTRLWPVGADVQDIPRLDDAIAHSPMQEDDLSRYARGIHAYGNADDTYGRSCRFWVELGKGETTSLTAFARAFGIVNQYFLLTNSSEVNRILRAAQ